MQKSIVAELETLIQKIRDDKKDGYLLFDLPTLSELRELVEQFHQGNKEISDRLLLDIYEAIRVYSYYPQHAPELLNLLYDLVNFGYPYEHRSHFQRIIWRGMLVIGIITTAKTVNDPDKRCSILSNLHYQLGFLPSDDLFYEEPLEYLKQQRQFSEISDINWFAANLELRRAIVGLEGYRDEINYAIQLGEVTQDYNPQLHALALNLIVHIEWKYHQFDSAYTYGIDALKLSRTLNRPHNERQTLLSIIDTSIRRKDQQIIDLGYAFWEEIETPTNQYLRNALINSSQATYFYHSGDYQQTKKLASYALKVLTEHSLYRDVVNTHLLLAMTYTKLGETDQAVYHSHAGFNIAHHRSFGSLRSHALYIKGWIFVIGKKYVSATHVLTKALHSNIQQKDFPQYQSREDGIVCELAIALNHADKYEIYFEAITLLRDLRPLLENASNRVILKRLLKCMPKKDHALPWCSDIDPYSSIPDD